MTKFLRDIFIIARQELDDSVRSRRAAVVLILYLAGAMLACNGFISAIHKVESQLTEALSLQAAATPGAVTDALWESARFRRMVISLVGDRETAMEMLSVPPIALIYGWLAFMFIPALVMLCTSSRIADEVAGGSCRFVLLRTSRPAWCIGKFVGQSLLVVLALALSAVGAWCTARFRLAGMDGVLAAQAMFVFAAKAWVYALAFVGLALGISQLTRSPHLATAGGLLAWIVIGVLFRFARHFEGDGIRQVWALVGMLTPHSHRWDLMRSAPSHVISGAVFCVALGLVFLMAGHAVFRKRDL